MQQGRPNHWHDEYRQFHGALRAHGKALDTYLPGPSDPSLVRLLNDNKVPCVDPVLAASAQKHRQLRQKVLMGSAGHRVACGLGAALGFGIGHLIGAKVAATCTSLSISFIWRAVTRDTQLTKQRFIAHLVAHVMRDHEQGTAVDATPIPGPDLIYFSRLVLRTERRELLASMRDVPDERNLDHLAQVKSLGNLNELIEVLGGRKVTKKRVRKTASFIDNFASEGSLSVPVVDGPLAGSRVLRPATSF